MGKKKSKASLNAFIERLKKRGLKDPKITPDGRVTANVPLSQIRTVPYDPEIIEMGGEKSFAQFIHRCLQTMGLGTSPENNYEWDVKSMMSWFDPQQPEKFPILEPGPGRIEEPIYVFGISKLRGKPFTWAVAAEVDDVLRGCHVKYEKEWAQEYCGYIQRGIIDRLNAEKNPEN
jgi:hypothetical protein